MVGSSPDGHVNNKVHSVYVTQKDETLLQKVVNPMGVESGITPPCGTRKVSMLTINSKIIKEDLNQLGITPNKSSTVVFPNVPTEYLPAFVRGVIDGDGWVDHEGYSLNVTTASEIFVKGLSDVLIEWNLFPDVKIIKSNSNTDIYRVWIKGKKQVLYLADIIYNDCGINYVELKKKRMTYHQTPVHLRAETVYINSKGRISFRTTLSSMMLDQLKQLALE